jgi:uncharacterized SAM-binding protein YcdF (DUF218 family)
MIAYGSIVFNYASKFLALFFDPFHGALLLAVGAIVSWKKRSLALRLLAASIFVLVVFSCPEVSLTIARSLEAQYRDSDVAQMPEAPAIVVLGGTIHTPNQVHPASALADSSDRLLVAYRLYRAGKAPLVICSGGNNPWMGDPHHASEARSMSGLLEEWGIPAAVIEVEENSIDTRGNALFSYRILSARGIRKIILVTSAMHMPRAAAAFRKVGFEVIPAPADFRTGWEGSNPFLLWLPKAESMELSEKALHEWLGLWVYRLRGWA